MRKISVYIWMILVLVVSQVWISEYYLLVISWVFAGLITKLIGSRYVFLKAFFLEFLVIAGFIFLYRDYYLPLEDWMMNLNQSKYVLYGALAIFNALNAGFCFLMGSAFIKPKKKKTYSGPYHF